MIELKGKFADAHIFADIVDEETYSQIIKVINNPVAKDSYLAIMADCHAGAGCVIGTTMQIKDRVCPNLVGVDIGCGMLTVKLGKLNFDEEDFKRFDDACHNVPSGFCIYKQIPEELWTDVKDPKGYLKKLHCFNNLKEIDRLENSMGTLGGGNHFIELDIDDEGNYYLVIHSGSRNLGKQVCEYYQKIALRSTYDHKKEIDTLIKQLKEEGKEKDIEKSIKALRESFPTVIDDLAFLEGDNMQDYIDDLKICQDFAHRNRKAIAYNILMNFFELNKISKWDKMTFKYGGKKTNKYLNDKGKLEAFETIHNYIDLENMILRKGAVSAQKGETLLIPINMRDGSMICVGKGNPDFNYSAPHGAGRIMSRRAAKDSINLDDYVNSMKGIHSSTVNSSTIDEAPFAYKPISSIIENTKETVDIIKIIKPIYNFKASDVTD